MNYTADVRGDLIFDGFEPMTAAPCRHDEHDLNLSSDCAQEIAPVTALALDPEQSAPSEDGRLNLATEAADSAALEPNTDLTSNEACVIETSDSSPAIGSEPRAPVPIEADQALIVEFSSADIGNVIQASKPDLMASGAAVDLL